MHTGDCQWEEGVKRWVSRKHYRLWLRGMVPDAGVIA